MTLKPNDDGNVRYFIFISKTFQLSISVHIIRDSCIDISHSIYLICSNNTNAIYYLFILALVGIIIRVQYHLNQFSNYSLLRISRDELSRLCSIDFHPSVSQLLIFALYYNCTCGFELVDSISLISIVLVNPFPCWLSKCSNAR